MITPEDILVATVFIISIIGFIIDGDLKTRLKVQSKFIAYQKEKIENQKEEIEMHEDNNMERNR